MVDLLATKLGGTLALRPVNSRTLLTAWRTRALELDPRPRLTTAGGPRQSTTRSSDRPAELGAGQLVEGELVNSGVLGSRSRRHSSPGARRTDGDPGQRRRPAPDSLTPVLEQARRPAPRPRGRRARGATPGAGRRPAGGPPRLSRRLGAAAPGTPRGRPQAVPAGRMAADSTFALAAPWPPPVCHARRPRRTRTRSRGAAGLAPPPRSAHARR